VLVIGGCQKDSGYYQLDGTTMGTTYHITIDASKSLANVLHHDMDQKLININRLMSTYIEDSELSKFNRSDSTECQPISKETYFVIKNALNVSADTGGKFDATVAPLIANDHIPEQDVIQALLAKTGYKNIDLGNKCVRKKRSELSINLSAIAKGYAVDQIATLIKNHNISNYLVEIGGETASKGVNSKSIAWRLAIEAPVEQKREIQAVFLPLGMGVATSGGYRNYFEKNGIRYSHTIDPTDGKPVTHNLVSVTVLHPQTMLADAYATAFMVMGEKKALEFSEKNQLAIYLLVKTEKGFEARYSSAFSKHLQ